MSNFEKKLNSRKNLLARTIGLFVVLGLLALLGNYFPTVAIVVASVIIATGLFVGIRRAIKK